MHVGKRHKTAWSETKDGLLLLAIAIARLSAFAPVPQAPILTGQHEEGQMIPTHITGYFREEEPQTKGT